MINSDIYLHAGENCNSEIDDCRVAAERQFRDSSDSRMFARCNKQRDYCTMASDSRWFVLVYRYKFIAHLPLSLYQMQQPARSQAQRQGASHYVVTDFSNSE